MNLDHTTTCATLVETDCLNGPSTLCTANTGCVRRRGATLIESVMVVIVTASIMAALLTVVDGIVHTPSHWIDKANVHQQVTQVLDQLEEELSTAKRIQWLIDVRDGERYTELQFLAPVDGTGSVPVKAGANCEQMGLPYLYEGTTLGLDDDCYYPADAETMSPSSQGTIFLDALRYRWDMGIGEDIFGDSNKDVAPLNYAYSTKITSGDVQSDQKVLLDQVEQFRIGLKCRVKFFKDGKAFEVKAPLSTVFDDINTNQDGRYTLAELLPVSGIAILPAPLDHVEVRVESVVVQLITYSEQGSYHRTRTIRCADRPRLDVYYREVNPYE